MTCKRKCATQDRARGMTDPTAILEYGCMERERDAFTTERACALARTTGSCSRPHVATHQKGAYPPRWKVSGAIHNTPAWRNPRRSRKELIPHHAHTGGGLLVRNAQSGCMKPFHRLISVPYPFLDMAKDTAQAPAMRLLAIPSSAVHPSRDRRTRRQ